LIYFAAAILRLNLTDKELHFWVIGAVGMIIFLLTDAFFKRIAQWGISAISFVYTFTVLLVIAFGLEIQQDLTGRGNMEFKDIVYGLWGFIAIFAAYLCVKIVIFLLSRGRPKRPQ